MYRELARGASKASRSEPGCSMIGPSEIVDDRACLMLDEVGDVDVDDDEEEEDDEGVGKAFLFPPKSLEIRLPKDTRL